MGHNKLIAAVLATSCLAGTPAFAQEESAPVSQSDVVQTSDINEANLNGSESIATEAAAITEVVAAPEAAPIYKTAADGSVCELHVWPTENYLGIKMGLLSGFGALGALADMESNKDKVTTIKGLMEDYLGPRVQMEELEKLAFTEKLKLDGYKVIVQEPSPSHEDTKKDPEIKAKAKAMNKTIKAKQRLTDSTAPCYAELFTTHIFYHKAMMYGSNLFTGWIFREFEGDKQTKVGKGQVKNPLEYFPPKVEEDIEKAKVELRDAYAKDFAEYVEKKVFKVKRKR